MTQKVHVIVIEWERSLPYCSHLVANSSLSRSLSVSVNKPQNMASRNLTIVIVPILVCVLCIDICTSYFRLSSDWSVFEAPILWRFVPILGCVWIDTAIPDEPDFSWFHAVSFKTFHMLVPTETRPGSTPA